MNDADNAERAEKLNAIAIGAHEAVVGLTGGLPSILLLFDTESGAFVIRSTATKPSAVFEMLCHVLTTLTGTKWEIR